MQLDRFQGRSVLSEKLLRTAGAASEYEDDVAAELGKEAVAAFSYALELFEGLQRSSGEPAICHTADVAIRTADLGLPTRYLVTALLHDCVEDTSSSPEAYVSGLIEIERRFGKELRDNVRLLTNRYSIIVNQAIRSLGNRSVSLRMNVESLHRVAAEVRVLRRTLAASVQDELAHEYHRLAESLTELDLSSGIAIHQVNRRYNLATEIALHVYGLFIDDMVDDFKDRCSGDGPGCYDVVLVVKFMDAVDNLRTSAATEKMKLEKILRKTQMILDKSFHLHAYLHESGIDARTFSLAYEFLKYTLVEQMLERKRALQNLADTRFSPLSDFMVEQITALESKYKIDMSPPQRLTELRGELRSLNATPAT